MLKRLLLILCFAPVTVLADCGFAMTGDGMTIVVGKSGASCLAGAGFREAFAAELKAALADDNGPAGRSRRSIDDRSASGARLWALEERRFQSTHSGGRYYGQR